MRNLLGHLRRRHGLFLAASMAIFAGFEFLICAMVGSVDIAGAIQELMKSLPPAIQTLVGEQFFAGFTARGFLAFGWNHPIAHAVGTAVAIVFASRAVAGEIENGMIEIVLSQPLSRRNYLIGQTIFACISIAMLTLAGLAGMMVGIRLYGLETFGFSSLAALGVSYAVLQCAWYGFSLACSVVGREAGRVATLAFIVALVSYLVHLTGKLLPGAAVFLPYSLHTYHSPQAILVENRFGLASPIVLLTIFAICLTFSHWYFERRDLP